MSADTYGEIKCRLESVLADVQSIKCDLFGQFDDTEVEALSDIRNNIIDELESLSL